MCELLGMAFHEPVKPTLSFRGFRHRGEKNPHGWGLAYYPDEAAQVIKEPIKASESQLSEFVKNYPKIKSKIIVGHVRSSSGTSITYKNTHPFQRELNGKDYVFAHNGTLHDYRELETGRFKPIGETDSEYVFCHILDSMERKTIIHWTDDTFNWFHKQLEEVNDYGNFNCIISDGEYLFCYHDKQGYNGLCFVQRVAPFHTVRLLDEDFNINLEEEKEQSQKGFIIATRRLTDERWESFHRGELIVFKNGDIVYSSSGRSATQFSTPITEKDLEILKILRRSPHRLT
ncbi:MAG: class II glutamine amidotransferase, partial [Spirochaetes bacterium]|nr:class II glutamine amidotransferase [Spirochaetota bacterium]